MNPPPAPCGRTGCPSPTHDHYAAYRQGCRSEAARADVRRYYKLQRLGRHVPRLVDATGSRRRVQALAALGWRHRDIAAHAGIPERSISYVTTRERVRSVTATTIAAAYEALCMTPGPSEVTRRIARRRGWAPPLAWDDVDDPDETPNLGPSGPRSLAVDPARVAELTAAGRTAAQIADTLGCSERAVVRVRARNRRDGEAA